MGHCCWRFFASGVSALCSLFLNFVQRVELCFSVKGLSFEKYFSIIIIIVVVVVVVIAIITCIIDCNTKLISKPTIITFIIAWDMKLISKPIQPTSISFKM